MADAFDISRLSIKKFDGKDFVLWKDKIETALRATQCSEAISEDFEIAADNRIKDDKAKTILMSSIDDKILRRLKRN